MGCGRAWSHPLPSCTFSTDSWIFTPVALSAWRDVILFPASELLVNQKVKPTENAVFWLKQKDPFLTIFSWKGWTMSSQSRVWDRNLHPACCLPGKQGCWRWRSFPGLRGLELFTFQISVGTWAPGPRACNSCHLLVLFLMEKGKIKKHCQVW